MKSKLLLAWFLAAACLFFAGCNYDFPLTAQPTHKVDPRLLGDWTAVDKDNPDAEVMHVRQWDDSFYAVSMDHDIYRASHSDFAGVAFISAQDLTAGNRKYIYYRWALSADGNQLTLQGVSTKVAPESTKNQAAIQQLIKANLANPKLFDDELKFTRKKPRGL